MARRKRVNGVLVEVPRTCGDCKDFIDATTEYGKKHGLTRCGISNEHTYSFSNPVDRPVPRPTKCPFNPIKYKDGR